MLEKIKLFILSVIIAIVLCWMSKIYAEEPQTLSTCREAEMEDINLLAAVAEREAGNQGEDGMRYVISTVLNRVRDKRFPDNVHDVIYQPNQFSVVKTKAFQTAVSQPRGDCIDAVLLELKEQINTEVLYFNGGGYPSYGTPLFKYKDHYFSK